MWWTRLYPEVLFLAVIFVLPMFAQWAMVRQLDQRIARLACELDASVWTDENGRASVVGMVDGQHFRLQSGNGDALWLTIRGLDPRLRIGPAWGTTARTGDAEFDATVAVDGDPRIVDHLDGASRATLIEMVRGGNRLKDGVWSLPDRWIGASCVVAIRDALALAKRWQTPASTARLALTDPHNEVRVRAMLRLRPGEVAAVAREAATRGGPNVVAALSSPHADEVVAAALLLRDEGGANALVALRAAEARMEGVARDTVREAISAIRARAGDAGALSVAESEIGGLSRPSEVGGLSRGE